MDKDSTLRGAAAIPIRADIPQLSLRPCSPPLPDASTAKTSASLLPGAIITPPPEEDDKQGSGVGRGTPSQHSRSHFSPEEDAGDEDGKDGEGRRLLRLQHQEDGTFSEEWLPSSPVQQRGGAPSTLATRWAQHGSGGGAVAGAGIGPRSGLPQRGGPQGPNGRSSPSSRLPASSGGPAEGEEQTTAYRRIAEYLAGQADCWLGRPALTRRLAGRSSSSPSSSSSPLRRHPTTIWEGEEGRRGRVPAAPQAWKGEEALQSAALAEAVRKTVPYGDARMSPNSPGPSTPGSRRNSITSIASDAGLVPPIVSLEASAASAMHPKRPTLSRRPWLRCCEVILQNTAFTALMGVLTVFALIGDDARLIFFEASFDPAFDWLTGTCLLLFSFEMLLACAAREDYFPGFWFLADLCASASLVFDLTFVAEAIMSPPEVSSVSLGSNEASDGFEESEYARASRSSRMGSRIARILRVIRLTRLSRVIKHVHKVGRFCASAQGRRTDASLPGVDVDLEVDALLSRRHAESRVGKRLSEKTPQRVICIVLALLFVLPQFNAGDSVTMMPSSAQYGADVVFQAWQDFELATAAAAAAASAALEDSERLAEWRWDWEVKTLMYIFYHRYDIVEEWLYKLCWVGYIRSHSTASTGDALDVAGQAHLKMIGRTPASVGGDIGYMMDRVPQAVLASLVQPWTADCSEPQASLVGVSLVPGVACPRSTLRRQETIWYMPIVHRPSLFQAHLEGQFIFIFDVRTAVKWEAAMGIFQMCMVVMVLAAGALLFSRDVDRLVLHPIERMISKVEMIRYDPLYAMRLGESNDAVARQARAGGKVPASVRKRARKSTTMETKILENTIIKLGSLLALGFGEAGVDVIAENLHDEDTQVTAKVPGIKVEAIFGFCDIRHFHTITEVLKERTMVFVNQVAEIVHRVVDQHLGAANKNLGQAFLLVWQLGLSETRVRSKVADLSVMAFVKVAAELGRDLKLANLAQHPLLQSRMPNFRVGMGFGLHLGWAIAGAIGSEFKIDASYLSPHVNLASQLEAATQEYGVTILMSEPLVRSCNAAFARHFRPVDNVLPSGSTRPMQIFTVDLDAGTLAVEPLPRRRNPDRKAVRRERARQKLAVLDEEYEVHKQLVLDRHVRLMRRPFVLAFFQEFERGFLNYVAGEWDVAAPLLENTRTMLKPFSGADDGPSRAILEYMKSHNFEAPVHWLGWRELNLK